MLPEQQCNCGARSKAGYFYPRHKISLIHAPQFGVFVRGGRLIFGKRGECCVKENTVLQNRSVSLSKQFNKTTLYYKICTSSKKCVTSSAPLFLLILIVEVQLSHGDLLYGTQPSPDHLQGSYPTEFFLFFSESRTPRHQMLECNMQHFHFIQKMSRH